jgi:hypothetical protein
MGLLHMNQPLDTSANFPIKQCPEGFEARALLEAWTQQLYNLLKTPGVNMAEINACIIRISEIAHEATENSRPNLKSNIVDIPKLT